MASRKTRERRLGERGGEILDLHAAAQVRLVGSVLRDRLRVRQPQERPRRVRPMSAISRSISGSSVAKTRSSVANEISRSTCVNSGWRSARRSSSRKHLHDLKVAVHAGDHQDLLEDLRRLRQREELAGVDAARHEVVARPFRRRLGQHRRLDLEEPLLVEVLPDRHRRAVAQDQVALHARPAQVDVAVLEPRLFGDLDLVGDHERRRLRLVQQPDLAPR